MRSSLITCWLVLLALHVRSPLASTLFRTESCAVSRGIGLSELIGSIDGLRLLPALIGVAAVLIVMLRALVLLQREMSRRVEIEQCFATQLSFQQTMMEASRIR